MKRIILLLAFYVLASVGAVAQVVGEEPYEILWEMEFDSTNYFVTYCISPDSNSYYYLGGETKWNEAIYKRNIETNEIEEKFPISFSDDSEYIWQMKASNNYLAYLISHNDTLYLRDINTFELKKKIRPDMNELINNFDNMYDIVEFRGMVVQKNSNYAILHYVIKNLSNEYFHFLLSYNLNNDTYNMFYDNLSWNSIDSKIEKLQLSNDGNKLYAVRYYSNNPGETLIGFYEWDLSNDFKRKELNMNITSDDISGMYYYKISPDNSKILLMANTNLNYLYYDLSTGKIIKTNYNFYVQQNYFCFSQFDSKMLLNIIIDSDYHNILYDILSENYLIIDSTSKLTRGFQNPIYYGLHNSTMISYNNEASLRPKKLIALKFNFDVIMGAKEEKSKIDLLYPNPASDYIEISIDGAHLEGGHHQNIEIYDLLGNLVINSSTPSLLSNATPQEGNLKIDVSQLPKGVYFVRIGNNVEKFVKL